VLPATRHSACAAKVGATNQLKALIVGAPEELRAELRGAVAPWLLELPGVGPISAAEVLARWPAAFGGRVRGVGWCQPDPSLLRAGHQASAEPLGGSAAQPRPAHGRGGPAARRPGDPCRCRSAPRRGQARPRRPAMPEAGGRQAAVRAAGMAGPARRGAGQPLVAASASAPCRLLAIGAQWALAQARLPHHRGVSAVAGGWARRGYCVVTGPTIRRPRGKAGCRRGSWRLSRASSNPMAPPQRPGRAGVPAGH
jgi:hypothetical protein